jgi:hypothetical protein
MTTAENDSRLYALDLVRRERNAARRRTEIQDLQALEHGREAKLEEFHARLAKDMEWNAYLASAEGSALVTPRGSTVSTQTDTKSFTLRFLYIFIFGAM